MAYYHDMACLKYASSLEVGRFGSMDIAQQGIIDVAALLAGFPLKRRTARSRNDRDWDIYVVKVARFNLNTGESQYVF